MTKILLSTLLAFAICTMPTFAAGFGAVRKLGTVEGTKITRKTSIEGVVVSSPLSRNNELNPNVGQTVIDTLPDAATAYIQSRDGRYGLRLQFEHPEDMTFAFGDGIRLDLRGCTVTREEAPERYTVSGLTAGNIVAERAGAKICPKRKRISELTDEDLYTLVTLCDAEFVFKNGRYANVDERYVRRDGTTEGMADGFVRMLRDDSNDAIAVIVNAGCAWRRNIVPQGRGEVTGIVVHTPVRRYGYDGRYALRPTSESDIAIPSTPASSFSTLAEWNWNDNPRAELKFEYHGTRNARYGSIIGDRILPDIGTGFLSTDCGAYLSTGKEYDGVSTYGTRKYGSLMLTSDARDWFRFDADRKFAGCNALIIETSTDGIDGSILTLDFTFGAGDGRAKRALRYPVLWHVEYSTDGETFVPAECEPAKMRPLPYETGKDEYFGELPLYYDTCAGFTEHTVTLPATLFGRKRLLLRITPVDNRISWKPADASAPLAEYETDFMSTCYRTSIRFGTVSVKYR